MYYRDDDYTDPWTNSEAVLMLHGNAESGKSWNGWMPHLGRRFRVVRPDLRGHGQSTPMPLDYKWSIDGLVDDYIKLVDHLGIERFHVVAAKTGGPITLRLASRYPERVRSIAVVGCPATGAAATAGNAADLYKWIERDGAASWARATMRNRLGSQATPEMLEAWVKVMASTARSTQLGYVYLCETIDIAPDLPKITAPTLVITTEGSGLGSVEATRAWQQKIENSELLVLPGDSYHAAVTHPDLCAKAYLEFIDARCVPS